MPRIADETRPITAGVDTHADTHVAAAVDQVGRVLGTAQFPADPAGFRAALAWARSHGELARPAWKEPVAMAPGWPAT